MVALCTPVRGRSYLRHSEEPSGWTPEWQHFAHVFENGCKFAIRMASQMTVLCTRVRERSKICHPDAHPDGRTLHTCSGTAPNSQRGLPPESRKHVKRSVSVWYKCSQISTDCLKDDRPVSGRFCLQGIYIGTSGDGFAVAAPARRRLARPAWPVTCLT